MNALSYTSFIKSDSRVAYLQQLKLYSDVHSLKNDGYVYIFTAATNVKIWFANDSKFCIITAVKDVVP